MEDQALKEDDKTGEHHVRHQNMAVLVFVGALILFSIWLVDVYGDFIKKEKCIESHRRNCNPIEIPRE